MPVKTLAPKGGGFGGGPTSIGERNECQRGHWAPKGVDCDVPHWLGKRGVDLVVVPRQLEKGTSASEDTGPRRGWIVMSHIGWGGEQITFYKGCRNLPSLKGKAQGGQYRGSPKRTIFGSGGSGSLHQ